MAIQEGLTLRDGDRRNHAVCEGEIAPLSAEEVHRRTDALPGWHLRDGRLHRTFHFDSFPDSMDFVRDLAELSERWNHHPNFCVEDKRRVHVVLWTRKMSCLTEHDFFLAAALSQSVDGQLASPA